MLEGAEPAQAELHQQFPGGSFAACAAQELLHPLLMPGCNPSRAVTALGSLPTLPAPSGSYFSLVAHKARSHQLWVSLCLLLGLGLQSPSPSWQSGLCGVCVCCSCSFSWSALVPDCRAAPEPWHAAGPGVSAQYFMQTHADRGTSLFSVRVFSASRGA